MKRTAVIVDNLPSVRGKRGVLARADAPNGIVGKPRKINTPTRIAGTEARKAEEMPVRAPLRAIRRHIRRRDNRRHPQVVCRSNPHVHFAFPESVKLRPGDARPVRGDLRRPHTAHQRIGDGMDGRDTAVRQVASHDLRAEALAGILLARIVMFDTLRRRIPDATAVVGHGRRLLKPETVRKRAHRLTFADPHPEALRPVLTRLTRRRIYRAKGIDKPSVLCPERKDRLTGGTLDPLDTPVIQTQDTKMDVATDHALKSNLPAVRGKRSANTCNRRRQQVSNQHAAKRYCQLLFQLTSHRSLPSAKS